MQLVIIVLPRLNKERKKGNGVGNGVGEWRFELGHHILPLSQNSMFYSTFYSALQGILRVWLQRVYWGA
jgi:hypothetical protein